MAIVRTTCALLLTVIAQAAASQTMTNEQLFDNCKAFNSVKDRTDVPPQPIAVQANRCIAYLAGASQVYSVGNRSCDLSKKRLAAMANDYMEFTRRAGVLQEPAAFVVHALLDDCYCGKAPVGSVMDRACPKPD